MRYLLPPLLVLALAAFFILHSKSQATVIPRALYPARDVAPVREARPADVWLVEQSADAESYSNGLRIDTRWQISNHPRSYIAFPLIGGAGPPRHQPVGIVFHTTESRQAPFDASENRRLRNIGESLLEYVRRRRAYNYLIDRFGRVYRVVAEGDAANHAGYSVWADERWAYVNLNESFLGIAFEAETQPGENDASFNPAQAHATAMLTEMLRARYGIAAGNCVTHAQVSVNPSNFRAGYHTDWASAFPFTSLGLADNYLLPLPAVWLFGFDADETFLRTAGARLAASADLAQQIVTERAQQARVPARAYRNALRARYSDYLRKSRQAKTENAE